MSSITQEQMGDVAHLYLMPFALLINFSLCQYIFVTFYARRQEIRISALLVCSAVGFLAIVPFSHTDKSTFKCLNDISETASTLTFLIQIVVLGRDVTKKARVQSLTYLTHVAEIFVALEMLLMVSSIVTLCGSQFQPQRLHKLIHLVKDAALWFIFFSRLFYIRMTHGARTTRQMEKAKTAEIFVYLLLATHTYPFISLEAYTEISWQPAQAFWNRLTLLFCILHTVAKDKLRRASTPQNKIGTVSYAGTLLSVGSSENSAFGGQQLHHLSRRCCSAGAKSVAPAGPSMVVPIDTLAVSFKTGVPVSWTEKTTTK